MGYALSLWRLCAVTPGVAEVIATMYRSNCSKVYGITRHSAKDTAWKLFSLLFKSRKRVKKCVWAGGLQPPNKVTKLRETSWAKR